MVNDLQHGYIYVLSGSMNGQFLKVGSTKSLENRMNAYKASMMVDDLIYVYTKKFVCLRQARKTESEITKSLSDYCFKGREYFRIPLDVLMEEIEKKISSLDESCFIFPEPLAKPEVDCLINAKTAALILGCEEKIFKSNLAKKPSSVRTFKIGGRYKFLKSEVYALKASGNSVVT